MASKATESKTIVIAPIKLFKLRLKLIGTAPLVINRMSAKMRAQIAQSGEAKKGKHKKVAERDSPEDQMNDARHISTDGWDGIHAGSFKGAIVTAARSVEGLTLASLKAAVRIVADGYGVDGSPLVKIHGKPTLFHNICRTATGQPIPRYRPRYWPWHCNLTIEFNAHILGSEENAVNLVALAGLGGVGDVRTNAKESYTQDGGTWEIASG